MQNEKQLNVSEKFDENLYVSREEYSTLYETTKPNVEIWKNKFEEFVEENKGKIDYFFEKAAFLYGSNKPDEMRVELIFNPNEGNTKGEPVDNFSGINPDLEKKYDVIYWVPKPDDYLISASQIEKHVKGLLHEGEHQYFQGESCGLHPEGFNKFLEVMDTDPKISELKEQLFGTNTGYLEPTNELITVYLENLFDLAPQNINPSAKKMVTFENDEETSFNTLKAAMYYQERDFKDSPTTQGPYANIRRGYRKLSSVVLNKEISESTGPLVNESTGGAVSGEIKISPYNFKHVLPSNLLEEYLAAGKVIDRDFVVSLYEMALHYHESNQ